MDRFRGQGGGYGAPVQQQQFQGGQQQGGGYPFAGRSYLGTSPQFNRPVGTQTATDPRMAPWWTRGDRQATPPVTAAATPEAITSAATQNAEGKAATGVVDNTAYQSEELKKKQEDETPISEAPASLPIA